MTNFSELINRLDNLITFAENSISIRKLQSFLHKEGFKLADKHKDALYGNVWEYNDDKLLVSFHSHSDILEYLNIKSKDLFHLVDFKQSEIGRLTFEQLIEIINIARKLNKNKSNQFIIEDNLYHFKRSIAPVFQEPYAKSFYGPTYNKKKDVIKDKLDELSSNNSGPQSSSLIREMKNILDKDNINKTIFDKLYKGKITITYLNKIL